MVSIPATEISPAPAADPKARPRVVLTNVTKRFVRRDGTSVAALHDVSLDVAAGEFVVLLGPSGCGKTTLLRCVAGLERPDAGEIILKNRTVFSAERGTYLPPEERDISMMFQTYALWPHMTVRKNIAYPLRARKVNAEETNARVERIMSVMEIKHLADEYPAQLSGGQQQRVGLARSLVTDPDVVVFDEPLSNLDARVRKRLRVEVAQMQRDYGFSAIYVTHDQEEAMHIADRIVMMQDGGLVRVGDSRSIYERPQSRYVAGFIGSFNEFKGTAVETYSEGSTTYVLVDTSIGIVRATLGAGADPASGDEVWAGIRPEGLRLLPASDATGPRGTQWPAQVVRATFLGTHMEYLVRVGETVMEAWSGDTAALPEGSNVTLSGLDFVVLTR